jgi:hypothetical protein
VVGLRCKNKIKNMNKKIPTGITMGIIIIFALLIMLYFLPFLFNYILAEKINANKIIKLNTNISPVEAEVIANKLYKLQFKSLLGSIPRGLPRNRV